MRWLNQLKRRLRRNARPRPVRRSSLAPWLEALEDRVVPALTNVPLPPGQPATVVVNAFVSDQGQVAGTVAAKLPFVTRRAPLSLRLVVLSV